MHKSIRLHIVRSLKMCMRMLFKRNGEKMKNKAIFRSLCITDLMIWGASVVFIIIAFILFDRVGYLTLISSLVGITSLIFCAKGDPIGPLIMVMFGVLYGIISFSFKYYGEVITYLGMTAPMSLLSLISWVKNPYKKGGSEVKVSRLTKNDIVLMCLLTVAVTAVFYFILKVLNTANLIPSTVSVTTSFMAVFLTYKRSPYYALAYAANDIVLIILWVMAALNNKSYVSVAVCFVIFLVNDLYGFMNWRKMERRQVGQFKNG